MARPWQDCKLPADTAFRLARYHKEKEIQRDVEPLAALHPALA